MARTEAIEGLKTGSAAEARRNIVEALKNTTDAPKRRIKSIVYFITQGAENENEVSRRLRNLKLVLP